MKRLAPITVLLASLLSLNTQADATQWRDSSDRFRLIMLDPATTAYPVLLYGSTQRSGPDCPRANNCAFVGRGRLKTQHALEFEPLRLSASREETEGLEGHQSEMPGQAIHTENMVWSFYITDARQARLTCISPKASCQYFNAEILLSPENASAIHP